MGETWSHADGLPEPLLIIYEHFNFLRKKWMESQWQFGSGCVSSVHTHAASMGAVGLLPNEKNDETPCFSARQVSGGFGGMVEL